MNYFSKLKISAKRGFTLVELLVVMTIATIITTSLIIQQSKWNDQLAVNTQAYELALMIRQAQIYSLGVREYMAGTGDKFNIGYGIYIDQNNPGQYIFFVDKDGNLKYDSGEEINTETKTLTRGVTVNRFCGVKIVGQYDVKCSPDSGNMEKVSVSFFRPEPKANVSFIKNNGGVTPNYGAPATIYLRSTGGKESSIKIEANGQVSIIQ